jgi:hypothetical protein
MRVQQGCPCRSVKQCCAMQEAGHHSANTEDPDLVVTPAPGILTHHRKNLPGPEAPGRPPSPYLGKSDFSAWESSVSPAPYA